MMAYASVLHPKASADGVVLVWVAISAAVVLLSRRPGWARFDVVGVVAFGLTLLPWGVGHVLEWASWQGAVLGHPGLWEAVLWSGALVGVGVWWLPREVDGGGQAVVGVRGVVRLMSAVGAVAETWLSTTLEVARVAERLTETRSAELGAVSLWWGLFGAGLSVVGVAWRARGTRVAGLALMSVAAVKAVVVGASETEPLWRIASFFVVGLLMLVVAFVYAAVARRLGSGEAAAEEGNGE